MEMVGIRLRNAKENNRFDSNDEGAGMSVEDISDDDLEEQVRRLITDIQIFFYFSFLSRMLHNLFLQCWKMLTNSVVREVAAPPSEVVVEVPAPEVAVEVEKVFVAVVEASFDINM